MNLQKEPPFDRKGFTLVELLLAMSILAVLVVLLSSLLGGVSRAWISGEQQVETYQDGRAILELMSRELAQSVISPRFQMVQNVALPAAANVRQNTVNLFWQAALHSTPGGNVSEVGYFLRDDFHLMRFFVPPEDATNYQIFAAVPSDISAPWTAVASNSALHTPVSGRVIGFWARSFDLNGDLIPWLSSAVPAASPLQFNSAAHFQPAISGQPMSFKYTAASTATAHLLPASIELTIVTLDSKSLQRSSAAIPPIPAGIPPSYSDVPPAGYGPEDVPNAIDWFNRELVRAKIKGAQTFTTRVSLKSRGP